MSDFCTLVYNGAMYCSICQRATLEGATFCTHCGARLAIQCSHCDASNPLDSNYCHACGTQLVLSESTAPPLSQGGYGRRPYQAVSARCERCGTINEPASVYCFHCGYEVSNDPVTQRVAIAKYPGHLGIPAGFWIRFGALIIDQTLLLLVLLLIVGAIISGVPDVSTTEESGSGADYVGFLMFILYFNLYFTIGVAAWRTTIGKRIFRVYVIRTDGSRVGFVRAFTRYWASWLSVLVLLIGFLMIGFRDDKRGLHDLICDTMVVRQ